MSIQQIIYNITNNIQDRDGSKDMLDLLEIVTRLPITSLPMINSIVNSTKLKSEKWSEQLPPKTNNNIVIGWPGIYWINETCVIDLNSAKHTYYCVINNDEVCQTHGLVRGFNWWNDLYTQLNTIKIFEEFSKN